MNHKKIKSLIASAIGSVSSSISDYAIDPAEDFTRNRKFPASTLMQFLIAGGLSSTKNEILDFFGMSDQDPSSSTFFQQREKLKPEALHKVFDNFNESVMPGKKQRSFYEGTLKPLMDKAEKSELTLLFLDASHFVMGCDFLDYIPPYSPNLNLIKRLWKFVKNELRSKYYDDFDIFRQRIDSIIESTSNENKNRVSKLIGKKIQPFDGLNSVCKNTFAADKGSTTAA